ncbi:Hsp70 family protein [Frankia sp. Mgl5]|uniref:Hsp70 family protein n=1 Tax=Frankia sp. Mgl5 TaxID=2933793 RepID=UPI00200E5FD8|nr:Hsp70 family protein [Frankia sp. Mgl5]MCK9931774.1 Hsp70 family protein [Frankia sp. Mgl5]
MADWSLAIDFGTSFTTAAMSAGGGAPELLEIDNSRYLPSVVCLDDDGQILTGRAAVSQAAVFPERAERLPKRALVATSTVRLGGRDVPTVDLVAAVLRRIAAEALRRQAGDPPGTVTLTHPAGWGPRELDLLGRAAGRAGLPAPRFVPEPVAAAIHYTAAATAGTAGTATGLADAVAVYDLGGGTFDTAVLRRVADGYEVCGAPGGDPHFGGEDLDALLQDLIAGHLPPQARDAWNILWAGDSRRHRRAQAKLRLEITAAKEALSENPTHTLHIDDYVDDAPEDGIRITRAELEQAADGPLGRTRDEFLRTITAAGVEPENLTAVYLTGGATRTPYVASLLAAALGRLPTTSGDPKAVVVLGALTTPPSAPRGTARKAGRGGGPIRRPEVAAAPWTARLGILSDDEVRYGGGYPGHVVDGDVVYAQSPAGIFAFDARCGEPLWENPEMAGAPCGRMFVAGDLLVSAVGPRHGSTESGSRLWVGDRRSGAELWHRALPSGPRYHGLAVDASRVFVNIGQVQAFSLTTGDQLWSTPVQGYGILRDKDLLYLSHEAPGRVSALSAETGTLAWSTPTKDQFWCVPATDGNLLFVGAGKSVLALDMRSGGIVWKAKDYRKQTGTIGVGQNGHIYPSQFGGIRALRAHDGKGVGSFNWPRGNSSHQNRTAAHATADRLYATSDDGLLAFPAGGGTPVWHRKDLRVFESTVTVAHGLVYAVTADGHLHAVDAATGRGSAR